MPRKKAPDRIVDSPVARAIRQRGLVLDDCCDASRSFLPYLRTGRRREAFLAALRSYAFRLFLRDILVLRDRYLPSRLGPFFTDASAARMARQAQALGLIDGLAGGKFRFLATRADDFGDTFEWFVAQTLQRDFLADALWKAVIPGLPCGGDFDVLALLSEKLLYVETKTSPPKHIEQKEVSSFLARTRVLSPDIAILLVDTHLRMKDKLVPMMERALREEGQADFGMTRVEREIFGWGGRLYLSNAKRDIGGNLAAVFRDAFTNRFFP